MTRRTSPELEKRLDALESTHGDAEQIYVVSIGGDPDKPRGWLSPEEYECYYGERPESGFRFDGNSGSDP